MIPSPDRLAIRRPEGSEHQTDRYRENRKHLKRNRKLRHMLRTEKSSYYKIVRRKRDGHRDLQAKKHCAQSEQLAN